MHETTILQLFILLPYEIEEAKVISFDSLNRTEFVEKPGYISVMDEHGTFKSILCDGPLRGEEILGGGGGPHVSVVGDLCHDPVIDIVKVAVDDVGDFRHDPVVDIEHIF